MGVLKRVEGVAKRLLALLMAGLLYRPGRRARVAALVRSPKRVLLVRPDARVGEALLMTPLMSTLKSLVPPPEVDVLLHEKVRRILAHHPNADRILALDRRRLFLGPWAPGIRALRAARYDLVVDCGNWEVPSVTSAILSRLAGPRAAVLGPGKWPASALHDLSVAPKPGTRSEVSQRLHLLSPLPGLSPKPTLSVSLGEPGPALVAFLRSLGGSRFAVVNPGGRLGWRCASPELFHRAVRELAARGVRPVVTWGPGEAPLAERVRGDVQEAVVAPATTLDELGALMRGATLTVCNNTGPMHLSVAVGTPTLALFLHMDVERWGHGPPHRMLDLTPNLGSPAAMEAQLTDALNGLLGSLRT
jgi:ADP-heptose:LPS heptosyltransferase